MITEDYVSFEVARLLKEKGFNEICRKFYKCWPTNPKLYCCDKSQMFDYCTNSLLSGFNYVGDEMNIAAPTHQMAMKWLREEKNIFIDVYYDSDIKGYMHSIIKLPKGITLKVSDLVGDTYEQACEEAIKYCMENLI